MKPIAALNADDKPLRGPQSDYDGYLRMSLDRMLCSQLFHVVSGLDASNAEPTQACGRRTTVSGYTEWASAPCCPISIGWDWTLDLSLREPRLWRAGYPRSNVMLVRESTCADLEWTLNLEFLATIVDALPWQEQAELALFGTPRLHMP